MSTTLANQRQLQQNPLSNECRNCKMRFDTAEALTNHQKKFCQGSSYQDVGKLEQRLQELGNKPVIQNPNLNFQDVRNYLRGDGPVNTEAAKTLQNMNLDDLRNYFHSENQTFDEMTKQAMRARERELVQELDGFKRDKAELRLARLDQDRALGDLAKELELKKERDNRAKLEKQQIAQALQEIEQTKMSAMERDKRRELERLAAEREALRHREEEVIDEIRDLEWQMEQKQRQENEDRQRMRDRINDITTMDNPRRREIEFAKQRGEQISLLLNRRDLLERDRKRIMEDLEKVKQGDMSSLRKNEASRWVANDILQRPPSIAAVDISRVKLDPAIRDKLLSDQIKITKLKEMREKTLQDFVPENDDFDPLTRQYQQATNNNSVFAQFNRSEGGAVQHPSPQKLPPIIQSRPGNRSNRVTFEDEAQKGQGNPMIEKLRKLREDYQQTQNSNSNDPEFHAYLNDLENHILRNEPLSKPKLDHPVPQHQPQQSFQLPPQQQAFYSTQQPDPLPPFQLPYIPPLSLPPIHPPVFPPQPSYIPPPPPQLNPSSGVNDIQRILQSLNPEPQPMPAQTYVPSKKKEEIDQLDNLLTEQARQNDRLEVELENLRAGRITFDEFERILNDPAQLELDRTKRSLLGRSAVKPTKRPGYFPDDFKFRQNEFRAEDMEVEERALMNLAAQEFDQLRILSKLPKNSDLYRHKMEQYKEMSAMRSEMEKLLQEQKLEKIRRDFEMEKLEDQRKFKHDRWLENQQKQLLEVKLNLAAQSVPEAEEAEEPYYEVQQYQQPPHAQRPPEIQQSPYISPRHEPPQQQPYIEHSPKQEQAPPTIKSVKSLRDAGTAVTPISNIKNIRYPEEQKQVMPPPKSVRSENQMGDTEKYLPFRGFNIFFDFIARIQRQYRSMRLVYAVYNVTRALIPPSLIDIHDAEPDPEDPNEKNRIIFKEMATIRNIQPHPSSTLIIEVQVPKPNSGTQTKYVSYGWTLLNLFDNNYNFNRGVFKLPLYMSPTKTDIDIRDVSTLQKIPDTVLLFRIGNPGDAACNFEYTPRTLPEDYVVPKIHLQSQNMDNFDLTYEDIPTVQESVPFNPQYQCRGARFYLHFMKYYVPPTSSRIQLTLYDGITIVKMDDDVQLCNWASKAFDSSNLMFSQPTNPMNQGLGISPAELARGEVIAVEDERTWLKDLYKMQFSESTGTKINNDICLVIQVMEQKGGRNDPSGAYGSIAYGVLRLNNPDGTIRYGVHDVPLFKPPINLTKRNPADLVKQVIKITVAQPTSSAGGKREPKVENQQLPQPNLPQPQVQHQPSAQQQDPSQPQQQQNMQRPNQPIQEQFPLDPSDMPFIKNELSQFTNAPFKEGEGVDIYIDGARFLPENATFSRVLMRGFTVDFIRVIDPVKGLCDLNLSTSRNPFYGFRYELRAPKLDPTIIIEVAVETIDRSDGLEKIIGYCYFPLFLNSQTMQQNTDRNQLGVILQNGSYQLPIYLDRLPSNKNINNDNIQNLEKIPCATILLRCFKAPMDGTRVLGLREVDMREWKNVGVIVDPSEYSAGKYNTQYCQVSSAELDVYLIKNRRSDPSMRQVAQYLMKLRGRAETLGDDDLIKWLDRNLVTNQSTPRINMRYFSGYVPQIGFRFCVERLHGITQKLPHLVATSIAPPGSLYQDQPKLTPDVTVFSTYSLETHWSSLQFQDDIKNFSGLPMASKLGFVIDVKALQYISQTQTQPIDVGWSFLPIFSVLGNEDGTQSLYVNSGLHSLPLFPGPVPKDIIGFISQNQENIISMLKPDKNEKTLDTTTVIVRVHDNQREWMAARGFYGDISYSYLNQAKLSKLAFSNETRWNQAAMIDSAKSATPPSMQTREGFMKAANIALSLAYGQ